MRIVKSNVSSVGLFFSDEGPTLETLDYTIRIGSTPTFLYFNLYTYIVKIIKSFFSFSRTLEQALVWLVNLNELNSTTILSSMIIYRYL